MAEFVRTRFYDLSDDADIQAAFEEFEKEREQAEVEEFAFSNKIEPGILTGIMADYIFDGRISEEDVRKRLEIYHWGILKTTALTSKIILFVKQTYLKYKAEGE